MDEKIFDFIKKIFKCQEFFCIIITDPRNWIVNKNNIVLQCKRGDNKPKHMGL